MFKLGSKALDKGTREQAPAIVAAVTGNHPDQAGHPGQPQRRKNARSSRTPASDETSYQGAD
jgi:hypothetical protein